MSNYPEEADVFVEKDGTDNISSSDPNNAFAAIETTQGLVGSLGKPQSWSTTLMSLLRKYRSDMRVEVTGGSLFVRTGEAVLESTDGSKWVFRQNSTDVTVTGANIDVGSLVATYYYVYAKAGAAATTAPIIFSTDINAPSAIGTAPYRRLGWFYNAIGGSLTPTYGGNFMEGQNVPNMAILYDATRVDITAAAYSSLPDSEIRFISSGRPVSFDALLIGSYSGSKTRIILELDSAEVPESEVIRDSGAIEGAASVKYNKILSAGTHIFKLLMKVGGGTTTVSKKHITVKEE